LSFPAVLGTGLSELDLSQLNELAEVFRWKQPDAPFDRTPRLVLLNFSLSGLASDPPDGLFPAACHLARAERFLSWDLQETCVWQPNEDELEGIRFAVGLGDRRGARRLAHASLVQSAHTVTAYGDPSVRLAQPATDYLRAVQNFREVLRRHREGNASETQVAKSRDVLRQTLDEDLVDPLMEDALNERGPLRSNLRVLAAEICRQAHIQAAAAHARQASPTHAQDGCDAVRGEKEITQMLKSTDRLVAIVRELCK
jgi:hypothetical protein